MIVKISKAQRAELIAITAPYDAEIEAEENKLSELLQTATEAQYKDTLDNIKQLYNKRAEAYKEAYTAIEDRRFDRIKNSPAKVLTDGKRQADAILKKLLKISMDFRPDPKHDTAKNHGKSEEELLAEIEPIPALLDNLIPSLQDAKGEITRLDKKQVINIIKSDLHRHYKRLDKINSAELTVYIKQAVSDLIKDEDILIPSYQPPYYKMLHDNIIDAVPQMSSRYIEINADGASIVEVGNIVVDLGNDDDMIRKLGIETHKLITAAVIGFTQNTSENVVSISLSDYIRRTRGPGPVSEANRSQIKKRLREYLDTIQKMNVPFTVASRKDRKNKKDVRMYLFPTAYVEHAKFIEDEKIVIRINQDYAPSLKKKPIMHYPSNLLQVDSRDPNTYRIGNKIATYYSNYGNVIDDKHNVIGIRTLFNVTDLPDIEDAGTHYRRDIIEKLEKSLNKLIDPYAILSSWYYIKPKRGSQTPQERAMTAAEVEAIRHDFDAWINSYIFFDLAEEPENLLEDAVRYRKRKDEEILRKKQRDAIKAGKALDRLEKAGKLV